MLKTYFQFLPGVGPEIESRWREQDILTWDDCLLHETLPGLSKHRSGKVVQMVSKCDSALLKSDVKFFHKVIPAAEHWRLFEHFKDDVAYLDIETTGLYRWDRITMVGISDGYDSKIMIRGINLDMRTITKELKEKKLLVTFNGKSFDVPFIEKRFPGTVPKMPHIDLRQVCARVGLRGGLKAIERTLGISRKDPLVKDMHGGDAVTLWKMWTATGDRQYLDILAKYNEEDILNLRPIMEHCLKKLRKN